MIAHFFSRDNETEAEIAFFHSSIPFHFSPPICTTMMAEKISRRWVGNSSWSRRKSCSAKGPRWGPRWGQGTLLSLFSPVSWVSPSSHNSLWSCLEPTGKRRWANRGRTRQPWDFLDVWLSWFIQQCTTLCCREGFITNNPKSVSAYFHHKRLGIILARCLQSLLKMEALLLCYSTDITW